MRLPGKKASNQRLVRILSDDLDGERGPAAVSHIRLAATSVILLSALAAFAETNSAGMIEVNSFDDVLQRIANTAPIPEDDFELHGRLARVWKTGKHMVFDMQGDTAFVFQQKRLTAQRFVAWVRTYTKNRRTLRDLLLYAEGDVKLTNGGGTISENKAMLVTVTGGGDVLLTAGSRTQGTPSSDAFIKRAADARHRLLAGKIASPIPATGTGSRPIAPTGPTATPTIVRRPTGPIGPATGPATGTTTATAVGRPLLVSGDDFKSTITGGVRVTTIVGNVRVRQPGGGEDPSNGYMEIAADNAVLWSAAGGAAPRPGGAMRFEGAYLEGDVRIRQGGIYIRSPRIYFDVAQDRFLILDGVLKARGRDGMMPLYLRAHEIHRVSKSKFIAHNAIFTTDPFAPPHYHLSAKKIELSEVDIVDPEAGMRGARMRFRANNLMFQVRRVPVGWLAVAGGEITTDPQPLKTVMFGYDDDFGATVSSKWFLWRLLGIEGPKGHRAELRLDYLGNRGPAVGVDAEYETDTYAGHMHGYILNDSSPERDEEESGLRGRFLARHKHLLPRDWSLTLELSYLSDRNFLREFDEQEDKEGKAQETLLYGKKQADNWAMTAQVQSQILEWEQTVERMPEVGFYWIAQPIAEHLVFYSENRIGWLRFKGNQKQRRDLEERLIEIDAKIAELIASGETETEISEEAIEGEEATTTTTLAELELARTNTMSLLTGELADTNHIARLDTRQEVQWPLKMGIWRVTPWASMRMTYQQNGPTVTRVVGVPTTGTNIDEEPQEPVFRTVQTGGGRLFGTIGVKARTDIQRVYNDVTNKLFDLHRLRHIITPEFTAMAAWSSMEYNELYGFDDNIDRNLDAFGAVDMRVKQRWQTMRGGPGKWQSVDWITLVVGATLYWDGDLDPQPIRGRFFDSKPELSQARDNVYAEAAWRLSETTSLVGDLQYDIEDREISFANIGVAVAKTPRMSYYVGARYVRAFDATVLTYTLDYRLNYKYRAKLLLQYDTAQQKFLETQVTVTRRMPGWIMELGFTYDQLESDSTFQISFYPVGSSGLRIGSFE